MERKFEVKSTMWLLKRFYSMLIIFFIISLLQSNAQTNYSKQYQAISFELGNTGLLYNLTYDYKLTNKGFRVVAGSNFSNNLSVYTTGVGAYYL